MKIMTRVSDDDAAAAFQHALKLPIVDIPGQHTTRLTNMRTGCKDGHAISIIACRQPATAAIPEDIMALFSPVKITGDSYI